MGQLQVIITGGRLDSKLEVGGSSRGVLTSSTTARILHSRILQLPLLHAVPFYRYGF